MRIALDLTSLQQQVEAKAVGSDPIKELVELVLEVVRSEGLSEDGSTQADLTRDLSRALAQDRWPDQINVRVRANDNCGPGQGARVNRGRLFDSDLFEDEIRYPNNSYRDEYDSLVGLDAMKHRLIKEAIVLTCPDAIREWSREHHGREVRALECFLDRAPFLLFAGDVGNGKTALAESFGDAVARQLDTEVTLLRMSILTRGSGLVGEMTKLLSRAFRAVEEYAEATGCITILLLDEADTLAESRETEQMHHEDRAGVNSLIQGIDRLRASRLPILVVFCTNRLDSLDPAIRRRAVEVFEFRRPAPQERRQLLEMLLEDLGLEDGELAKLVDITGAQEDGNHSFTYSDIRERLVPTAILTAYPDRSLSFEILWQSANKMEPTPPFGGREGS